MGQLRPSAHEGGKKGQRPGRVCGPKEDREGKELGRLEEKGERREGFLFLNTFQIHFFSNFQTSIKKETMHSNHDAQSLIISNLFK
jgi:hypothetical protein